MLDLTIEDEKITHIDRDNTVLKQMNATLRVLNLSGNLIKVIEHIDGLQNLRELNLSWNQIKEIEGLRRLSNVKTLILDHNKIEKIEGIKYLRKLEKLSLSGNLIKDLETFDSTEPMLDMRELFVQGNKLQCIEGLTSYPNIEELDLSDNPITMIFPGAFNSNKALQVLVLNNTKFKWPKEDLLFLKKVEGTLARLSMNNAFPKENVENIDVFQFLNMTELDDLSLRGVGLLNIKGISDSFPNISLLDLSYNRIFSVEAVEELHKLSELAEVSFKENPLCVHKHLTQMV